MRKLRFALLVAITAIVAKGAVADPLHDAAKAGDVARMTELLDAGADIDSADSFGSPLHWAILNKHDDAAELLISRGAEIDRLTDALGSPLHAAVQRGLLAQVRLLLANGAAVDVRDKDGKTPLHLAAFGGRTEIAQALIEAGADVNAIGSNAHGAAWGEGQFSALHVAEYNNRAEVAELLRASGAKPVQISPPDGLLDAGDPEAGATAIAACGRCHIYTEDQAEPNSPWSGPSLVGVVGRPVASVPDYAYTGGMRSLGGNWTEERLFSFIVHPMLAAPGTRMVFEDVRDPQEIANIIAYLRDGAS